MTTATTQASPKRLLVIVPDRVTDILVKGEYQPDYYNPGRLFDQVHILSTCYDEPDLEALQRTVGDAELHWHTLPEQPALIRSNWQRWWKKPLRDWAAPGVSLARSIAPHLIRTHGADWNTYLASRIKAKLGIPYVTSLHINSDINPVRRYVGPDPTEDQKIQNAFFEYVEHQGLINADLVMPVYEPIVPYLKRHGVERYEVCYNILNGSHLQVKTDYSRGDTARLIYVGRLTPDKNPDNIIHAVAAIPNTELTIVGDGPIRPELEELARSLNIADRIHFRPAVPNDELCAILPTFDLFTVHTEYWEISKSVLEALLVGMPIIMNRRVGPAVPELENADFMKLVPNTAEDYTSAISHYVTNDPDREALGRRAYEVAQSKWAPSVTEAKVVDIYRQHMLHGQEQR